jgi:hypothetical protein
MITVHRVARRISVMREPSSPMRKHSDCIGNSESRCWCLMAGVSEMSQDINIEDYKV